MQTSKDPLPSPCELDASVDETAARRGFGEGASRAGARQHPVAKHCNPWKSSASLLYGDGLGQVARLVHIATTKLGDVVRQQLQRYRGEHRYQVFRCLRNV